MKVLCAPLLTIDELFDDDHFTQRGFWQNVEHEELGEFRMPGRPFTMRASPWSLRRGAPRLGEHTDEVLSECGYSADQIAELRAAAAVA